MTHKSSLEPYKHSKEHYVPCNSICGKKYLPGSKIEVDTFSGEREVRIKSILFLREAFQKKPGYFITTCQRVGR